MRAEAMILMDTEYSGRYFDVRTCSVEAFAIPQELRSLCQSRPHEDAPTADDMQQPRYPAKGKLVSLHISIYAVDQAGAHGRLHLSPSQHATFKSSEELERLVREASCRALERQRQRSGKRGRE